ncbi:hypothetical protein ZEAMMB73_Zm00001d015062 [Zea mays]|uniref:Uncharacterized protein n=1 Tax=Zea mays TaxID=4577 RepID=A0A1D6GYY8_MAIZE|nr:hypothetical protein ZEAMMB73_Zm00001d015062 [Zea mays]
MPPRTPHRLPLRAAPTNLEAWSMAPSPSIVFPYVLQAPALPSPMRCTHKFGKHNLRHRFWKARSRSSNHNNYTPNFALVLIKKVVIPSCAPPSTIDSILRPPTSSCLRTYKQEPTPHLPQFMENILEKQELTFQRKKWRLRGRDANSELSVSGDS